ncbi:MAG: GNAT family N-acetyltransferase [Treponema sp.]|nr:GNAT family N-acetyltransferase [Treponema sp.]
MNVRNYIAYIPKKWYFKPLQEQLAEKGLIEGFSVIHPADDADTPLTNFMEKYGKYLSDLSIYDGDGVIYFERIEVMRQYRGQGILKKVMDDIIKYAKKNRKQIHLEPHQIDDVTTDQLKQIYTKFGFKQSKNDPNLMIYETIKELICENYENEKFLVFNLDTQKNTPLTSIMKKYIPQLHKLRIWDNDIDIDLEIIMIKPEYRNQGYLKKIMSDLITYSNKK